MKNVLLLLLLSVLSVNSFAQGNSISIFSEDGFPFYLIMNGIRQNDNPETNVRMDNLDQDYYASKIIFADNTIPDIDKKYLMVSSDDCFPCSVTYKIKTSNKGAVVMKPFNFSQVFVPPPPNVTVVSYNTVPKPAPIFGVNMQVTETTTTTTNDNYDNVNVGIGIGGVDFGMNVNINDGWDGESSSTTTTTTTVVGAPVVQQVVVYEEPGCIPMSDSDVRGLMGSLENQSFSDGKMNVAKQAVGSNCVYAGQVKQIMSAFTFEDDKLEFAKFAYGSTVDQNNYWKVNDAFDYSSTVDELNDYLGF